MTQNNFIKGLVIKEESQGEKSKLLSVLTENQGIFKMKAPGAKNLKSSTHSAVQLFTYSEFSIAKGRSGYLTITGATAKTSFFGLHNDILSYSLACYFSSAVSRFAVNDETSGEVLRLMLNCFYALSELKMSPNTVKPFFEIKLASICGFSPNFKECTLCGNKADTLNFDLFTSGLICEKCSSEMALMLKSRRFFKLTQKAMITSMKLTSYDMKKMFSLKTHLTDEFDFSCFYNFAESFICNIFQYEPKTLSFYNHLKRSINNEKLRKEQKNT